MNECPFCGGTLDCNDNDVWFCDNCSQVWIRVTRQIDKLTSLLGQKNATQKEKTKT